MSPLFEGRGLINFVFFFAGEIGRARRNKDVPRVHHDALEFSDGTCVLLTELREGQEGTALQLPAQPKR